MKALAKWLLTVVLLAGPAAANPAMLAAINDARLDRNRATLGWSAALERAAQGHADDMARRGYFSHTSPEGTELGARVAQTGYAACLWAENIAKGQRSVAEVMTAWMGSAGHRRNILKRDATEVGLARASGNVWVMVLARPC